MDQGQESTRHTTLYFEDGDLELSARRAERDGGGCQLFCVYRTQLRRVSPVFRDMLALGGDREEVVEMPDSAEDLAALLESVFISSSFVLRLWNTQPSRSAIELAGLARIARKYQVDDIANVVIRHISALWPKSLAEWDKTFPVWMANRKSPTTAQLVPEPASAIRFADEFNVPSILPAAFYFLAVQSAANIAAVEGSPHRAAVRWDLADNTTLLRLIRGRDHMRSTFLRTFQDQSCILSSCGVNTPAVIAMRDKCNAARTDVLLEAMQAGSGSLNEGQWDYLEILELLSARIKANYHIRPVSCSQKMTESVTNVRSALWEGLPESFAIGLAR